MLLCSFLLDYFPFILWFYFLQFQFLLLFLFFCCFNFRCCLCLSAVSISTAASAFLLFQFPLLSLFFCSFNFCYCLCLSAISISTAASVFLLFGFLSRFFLLSSHTLQLLFLQFDHFTSCRYCAIASCQSANIKSVVIFNI